MAVYYHRKLLYVKPHELLLTIGSLPFKHLVPRTLQLKYIRRYTEKSYIHYIQTTQIFITQPRRYIPYKINPQNNTAVTAKAREPLRGPAQGKNQFS